MAPELHGTGESSIHAATIDILPDDIFREIFASCLPDPYAYGDPIERMRLWQRLVHVCQRWRQIIYASPYYLDLHIYCSNRTPFSKDLSCWPEFPLAVRYFIPREGRNLIAALKHPDRVRRIDLIITNSEVEEVFAVMQVPFPMLTHLELMGADDEDDVPDLPCRFLGGSAPCLQHLRLDSISFPELPTLLLSARDLVSLQLNCIPPTGYISPEAMVVGLAVLTRLRTLCIRFPSPIPPHEQREMRPDPPMLTVLPALTQFKFRGNSEYLEDLVAQIDTPRVEDVRIEYFMQEVQTHQLSQFIGRSANLKLAQFKRAQVTFHFYQAYVELDLPRGECHQAYLSLTVLPVDPGLNSLVPSMVNVLGQLDAMLSNVDHLSVHQNQVEQEILESVAWLPLFRPFSAVEVLRVSGGLVQYIASALELEDTVLLPALQLLLFDDDDDNNEYKPVGSTKQFLSLRQLSGRPVTIVNSQDEFVEAHQRH